MIRKMQRIAVLALTICMILGTMIVNADYSHTLTVSGGNGAVGSGTVEGTTASIDSANKVVTVNGTDYDIKLPENDDEKYVVLGLKLAGRDNSEVYTDSVTFNVSGSDDSSSPFKTKDLELVVAYGLKSELIEYTVNYEDADGNELLPSETHYTIDGTRAVVSYKYIEGYLPDMENAVKTIKSGGDNDITFTYYEFTVDAEGNIVIINAGGAGGAGAGAGAAGAGAAGAGAAGAGAAGAGAANIGDDGVPLAPGAGDNVVDLDDNQTPQAEGDTNGDGVIDENDIIDDNKVPGTNWAGIAGGAALVAAIAAAAVAIARRRRAEETEDEE